MDHSLSKILIITDVIETISKNYKVSLAAARDMFYTSKICELLSDEETGLFGQSPLYIYSLFEMYYPKDSMKSEYDFSKGFKNPYLKK